MSNAENAVEAIYAKLATRNVQDLSGHTLDYWGANAQENELNTNMPQGLLYYNSGRCGDWARFYIDLLLTHGVQNVMRISVQRFVLPDGSDYVAPLPSGSAALVASAVTASNLLTDNDIPLSYNLSDQSLLMVHNWNIIQNQFYRENFALPDEENYEPLLSAGTNAALNGIEAQSNANPLSYFNDHALVRIVVGSTYSYYDPSYGTGPFVGTSDDAAFAQWEASSIVGFSAYVTYGSSPLTKLLWIEKRNDADTNTDLQKYYNY